MTAFHVPDTDIDRPTSWVKIDKALARIGRPLRVSSRFVGKPIGVTRDTPPKSSHEIDSIPYHLFELAGGCVLETGRIGWTRWYDLEALS